MNTKLGVKPNNYTKRNIITFFCVITALFIGVQPAFAGGISDIINTAIATIIKFVCKLIAGILANIIQLLLKGMGVDITEYRSMGLLSGFDTFTGVIRAIGIGIASVAIIWQFFTILFGPMLGLKQDKSVGSIITRALIFIPLTYGIQSIAESAFSAMQSVYSAILSGYENAVMGATSEGVYTGLITAMTNSELLNEYVVNTAAGAVEYFSLMGVVISALVLILVLWNFLKLVFEAIQRFAIMIVYIYLSPLATACGVVGDGSIPKKALSLFFSSGILWILNIWCIGVAQNLISLYPAALLSGTTGIMAWTFLNYGFVKIAQQLDDIFNAVGVTNVRLKGDLLGDLLGLEKSARQISDLAHSVKNRFAPKKDGNSGGGRNNNDKIDTTVPGVQSLPKTAKTEIDNALKATDETKRNAALNAAGKELGVKGGVQNVMNDPRVKDYMAHNKMGLADNQSLVSRQGYVGSEQAVVATKKADGSISFNKVSNLGSATSGGGNVYDPECVRQSNNKTVGAFNSNTAGRDNAVFKYTGTDGVTRAAQVDGQGPGKFMVTTANGNDMLVSAPKNATAGEVASMLNGSASEATRQKFEGHSYAADENTVGNAQSEFNINSSKGGEVMGGTFLENSPNATATIQGTGNSGSISLYRTHSAEGNQTEDTWKAVDGGGMGAEFNVAKGTGAAQAASEFLRLSGDDLKDANGVTAYSNDSLVSFDMDHKSTGPDLMQPDITDTYSGSRVNGTMWSDALNLKYSEDKAGNARMDLSYESGNNNTPFSIIETSRPYGGELGDKYYTIVSDAIDGGSATFKFNNKANINEVTAALISGDTESFKLEDAQDKWENIVRNIGFASHDNLMSGNPNFKSVVDKDDVANNSFAEILDCLNNNFNTKNNPVGNKK